MEVALQELDRHLGRCPPELKVRTPAHTKHLGWYLVFESRVTHRSRGRALGSRHLDWARLIDPRPSAVGAHTAVSRENCGVEGSSHCLQPRITDGPHHGNQRRRVLPPAHHHLVLTCEQARRTGETGGWSRGWGCMAYSCNPYGESCCSCKLMRGLLTEGRPSSGPAMIKRKVARPLLRRPAPHQLTVAVALYHRDCSCRPWRGSVPWVT